MSALPAAATIEESRRDAVIQLEGAQVYFNEAVKLINRGHYKAAIGRVEKARGFALRAIDELHHLAGTAEAVS